MFSELHWTGVVTLDTLTLFLISEGQLSTCTHLLWCCPLVCPGCLRWAWKNFLLSACFLQGFVMKGYCICSMVFLCLLVCPCDLCQCIYLHDVLRVLICPSWNVRVCPDQILFGHNAWSFWWFLSFFLPVPYWRLLHLCPLKSLAFLFGFFVFTIWCFCFCLVVSFSAFEFELMPTSRNDIGSSASLSILLKISRSVCISSL